MDTGAVLQRLGARQRAQAQLPLLAAAGRRACVSEGRASGGSVLSVLPVLCFRHPAAVRAARCGSGEASPPGLWVSSGSVFRTPDRFLETPLLAEVDREVGGFPGPRGCRVRHAELGSGL